jgi:hypothetical protein
VDTKTCCEYDICDCAAPVNAPDECQHEDEFCRCSDVHEMGGTFSYEDAMQRGGWR